MRVGKFKNMYGSGIKALGNLAEEFKGNSELTFEELNSEVAKHSSALENVSVFLTLYKLILREVSWCV